MKSTIKIIFCLAALLFCQTADAQILLNGDLEQIDPQTKWPVGWFNPSANSGYEFHLDSTVTQQGKYAISISSKPGEASFGAISCIIPHTFKGHQLLLKGFIKTEKVVGYAGLWLRVDGTMAFDNMAKQNLAGTTDWHEYSITLPYDQEKAININVGGLLAGTGKMWFDNVLLYLDGKPIEEASIRKVELAKAQKDTAFAMTSGIANIPDNPQEIKNLTLLGEVWGFVKYHHPEVAKGNINMDAELFRVMPAVIGSKNYADVCAVLEKWIVGLGMPKPCSGCRTYKNTNVEQKPDYGEIFDRKVVSAALADKLTAILNSDAESEHFYIGMEKGIGNPDFKHELTYTGISYPDAGLRLLCLFRYWNMIQYFFPYKHLIGKDWNTELLEMIPSFINAKNATDYTLATLTTISDVHDSHANIWSNPKALDEYRGKYAPAFVAKFIEDQLTVTEYYNDTLNVKERFKVGDVITSINGVSVKELIKKFLPITAASNYSTQLRDMPRNYLLRSNHSHFRFEVLHDGKTSTVETDGMAFNKLNFNAVYNPNPKEPAYHLMDNQIGYVYPGRYHNKDLPAIKKLFKDTKGIVIDMRCYPSEFMPFTFVPYIKSGAAQFVKFGEGSVINPGLFKINDPLGVRGDNNYKGKVVVIVNEESQSQAEYTTMAFQSSTNVTVIGSTTAGADGNVSAIYLPGGIRTMISGISVLYPDGTETQRKGVKIDVPIKPTIAGIKAGKDELLEKAVAIINADGKGS